MDAIVEFLIYQPWWGIYVAAFTMLVLCGLGMPVPEDIILFTVGYFAYNGLADVKSGILVCMAGVLIGDSIIYFLGLKLGAKLTKKAPFSKVLPEERLERTRVMFHKWGNKVIFIARFMPGLRAPVYFSAGTLHLPYRIFLGYDFLASIISVPLLVLIMYKFGGQVQTVIDKAHKIQGGIAILIGSVIALFVFKHFFSKWRHRKKHHTSHHHHRHP